ncbi:MAG TPA: sn-glycerol-3-phosphate ABC transporter ATP-binding protein UgpC [Gemmatimonadaceae bacterium]|nr:sn-glycerol-3-phosphate ABC transporter ATP-binding protein UgpC [Gemmatimonadaceae bacterium]
MARVTLEGVRKVYENGFVAVHGLDLEVRDGEFVVLVGPSGCGKSTTLRLVAGLESLSGGTLAIGDRVVNDVPPKARDIAMVFQSYALYPHMTVRENMAFALTLRKLPKAEIDRRVHEAATILGLDEILDRTPRQLSGGQRQRVAIGRAIVRQPAVFLFDEPLSNLDAKLRVQMRREIARLHRQLGATVIYVTHDQVEAMTMGERIVVMNQGRVQQVDAPLALYDHPRNVFVAQFIGSPAMNLVPGTLAAAERGVVFRTADASIVVPLPHRAGLDARLGHALLLGVRPEDLAPAADGAAAPVRLQLDVVEPIGNEILLHGRAGAHELTVRMAPRSLPSPGDVLPLAVNAERAHLFDAESGERIGVAPDTRPAEGGASAG